LRGEVRVVGSSASGLAWWCRGGLLRGPGLRGEVRLLVSSASGSWAWLGGWPIAGRGVRWGEGSNPVTSTVFLPGPTSQAAPANRRWSALLRRLGAPSPARPWSKASWVVACSASTCAALVAQSGPEPLTGPPRSSRTCKRIGHRSPRKPVYPARVSGAILEEARCQGWGPEGGAP
jgi:hypothetical protein